MVLKLYAGPTDEPLTLTELKNQLRIDSNDEDTFLRSLITVARRLLERYTFRSFMTQTWQLNLDAFPSSDEECIRLPMGPVQSVTSVTYYDESGVQQTLSPSVYKTDIVSEPGRIYLAENESWPTNVLDELNAVTIIYVAGYESADSVPSELKQAMLLMCGDLYLNRESWDYGKVPDMISAPIAGLCEPYRVFEFV